MNQHTEEHSSHPRKRQCYIWEDHMSLWLVHTWFLHETAEGICFQWSSKPWAGLLSHWLPWAPPAFPSLGVVLIEQFLIHCVTDWTSDCTWLGRGWSVGRERLHHRRDAVTVWRKPIKNARINVADLVVLLQCADLVIIVFLIWKILTEDQQRTVCSSLLLYELLYALTCVHCAFLCVNRWW